MRSWILLLFAIAFEVGGTSCMKGSHGLTRPLPSLGVFFCYGLSLVSLTQALQRMEISTAYAVWSGLGTVLITLVGAWYFGEPLARSKVACIGLIVLGVVGLNLLGRGA